MLLNHKQWWRDFWNRSFIRVSGKDDATLVSQGYVMQRYMVACSSRGEIPPKFNGGVFTVGHDIPDTVRQVAKIHDADYRAWGDSYWNQNNRLLYWPLIATGDTDLIKPWFNMYLNALALAKGKTKLYYGHDGASYPETMHFWGVSNLGDFGKNNPTNEIQSHWQKYHIQGTLEVIAQMLDTYDYNPNEQFARKELIPFADEIVTFYDQHYTRDANGKILMSPSQSLESYQLIAVNPTPDIAGLMSVLPRLLALPANLTTTKQRTAWAKTLNDLPPLPIGKTARGKLPPMGVGDPDGTTTILPAEKYGKAGNSENPELYVAFPYRLFGVGKPNLELAQNTFAARRSPANTCWGQDGTQSAVLGMASVAKKAAIAEFTNYGDQRFKWFWKPDHDWIPDLDNGGDGMITLQLMLMQCDDKRIQLLPAWPSEWTTDFKLHAPYQTTVEGHVQNGKISNLKVTPASRAKDVVVLKAQ
jgi:alpha-L-fucosidase 2